MRRSLLITCLLLVASAVAAQTPNGDTRPVVTETYEERFVKLNQWLTDDPDDILTHILLSDFYRDTLNPARNIPLAMQFITRAEQLYVDFVNSNRNSSQIRALLRHSINLATIRNKKQEITTIARTEIADGRQISETDVMRYVEAFKDDAEMSRYVRKMRVNSAYQTARSQNTIDAYYAFSMTYLGTAEADSAELSIARLATIALDRMESEAEVDAFASRYPKSAAVTRLSYKQKSKLAFATARSRNTVEAYRAFLSAYPSSDEYIQAIDEMEALRQEGVERLVTPQDYVDFIEANNDDALAEQAMDQFYQMITDDHNVEAAKLFLAHFQLDPHYNEVFRLFYTWHSEEGNLQVLQSFADHYSNYPFQNIVKADLDEARQIAAFDLMRPYKESMRNDYVDFIRHHTGKRIAFVALQRMLQPFCAKRDWKGASERMGTVMLSFEDMSSKEFDQLREIFTAMPTESNQRTALYPSASDARHAVMHPDGLHLYITVNGRHGSSIRMATYLNGRWSDAQDIKFSNTENSNIELYGFFDEGEKMLLGQEGDIWIAQHEGDSWRVIEIPPYPVNTDYRETDAFMLPDGTGLLLASDRPGGYNLQNSASYYHGDTALATDIYYIPRTVNGWGTPVTLGVKINTPYCERWPLLSRNQKTLYFISDGHGGMGYGDIYMATRDDANDWAHWNTPINLGRDVNSCLRELSISMDADEQNLIITAETGSRTEIVKTATRHTSSNPQRTINIDCSAIGNSLAQLNVADFGQQGLMREIAFPNTDHPVALNLYKGKRYVVFGRAKSRYIPSLIVDETTTATLKLTSYNASQLMASPTVIALPTVCYDQYATQPRPASSAEIDRLIEFLTDNPSLSVDIMVRVQGGDRRATYDLSLERAIALRRYFCSRGIEMQRIAIEGYGNSTSFPGKNTDVMVRLHKQ